MKQFKISAKNLAQLNMTNTCLRCFWNLLQLRHKTPFNVFPSIFSTFDILQKQLVESTLEKTGKFPKWLGEMSGAAGLADYPRHTGTVPLRRLPELTSVHWAWRPGSGLSQILLSEGFDHWLWMTVLTVSVMSLSAP